MTPAAFARIVRDMKKRRGWIIRRPGLWYYFDRGKIVAVIRRIQRAKKGIVPPIYRWNLIVRRAGSGPRIRTIDIDMLAPCVTIGKAMDVFDDYWALRQLRSRRRPN